MTRIRLLVTPELSAEYKLASLRHPMFQPAKPDAVTGIFDISAQSVIENAHDLNDFMFYTNYTNTKASVTSKASSYIPVVDPYGPYLFYPSQCQSNEGLIAAGRKYRAPVIAYIKQGNQIEEDIVDQLQAIFEMQAEIGSLVSALPQDKTKDLKTLNQLVPAFNMAPGIIGDLARKDVFKDVDLSLNSTKDTLGRQNRTGFGDIGLKEPLGKYIFTAFENQEALDDYIQREEYGWDEKTPAICFAFKVSENMQKNKYELELQFNDQFLPFYAGIPNQRQPAVDPSINKPNTDSYVDYSYDGFGYLENWVANTILKRRTGKPDAQIVTMTVPMKLNQAKVDDFGGFIQQLFTFFVLVMYIPPLYRTVYRIVQEKETRVKESMKIMGLSDRAYWTSWLAYYTVVNLAISFLSWLVMNGLTKIGRNKDAVVFQNTNDFLLWLTLFLFGQSLFGYILIIQSLFDRARSAAITTSVVYFGSAILNALIQNPDTPQNRVIAASLSPTVAMIKTFFVIGGFESSGVGVNFQTSSALLGTYSVAIGLRMLVLDFFVWCAFGLYLDQVLPKTFGTRKHPLFCFMCRQKKQPPTVVSNAVKPATSEQQFVHDTMRFETSGMNVNCYECVTSDCARQQVDGKAIVIEKLRKVYPDGFTAVKGINLKLFSNQIFVLLGHNGAGKTSTIAMLTGLFPATEGEVEIFGCDLKTQLTTIRSFMGVCPQHDVLFELLTPAEHLDIFYEFKGGDRTKKHDEIERLLEDVGVADKRDTKSCQLSGGNKRKLSVAIALCGGSKFVLLDEPSSGLDLSARRELWNMLRKQKKDRVILLTTHYMDEADILGDRIGIMSGGKMTCLGSSMFLKNKFGVGYHVSLEKESAETNNAVLPYFESNLGPGVKKFTEVASELSITVPPEYSTKFESFFTKLDGDLQKLQIRGYGVQISTLEQVFLKIGHLENPEEIFQLEHDASENQNQVKTESRKQKLTPDNERGANEYNLEKSAKDLSFASNLKAVLIKRANIYKRNRKSFLYESLIPALIILCGVAISKFSERFQRSPPKLVSASLLPPKQKLLINRTPVNTFDSDILPELLVANLPPNAFDVTYDEKKRLSTDSYDVFSQAVYQFGSSKASEQPYLYSSFEVFQANKAKQNYKFVSHVNATAQDIVMIAPQIMYESILKTALDDPSFEFKVTSKAYPLTHQVASYVQGTNAAFLVFCTAIAYSIILTNIMSTVVVERISNLKHVQYISGMRLSAYWIANFIFDFFKMQITIVVTLLVLWGFGTGLRSSMIAYVLLPFATLPFTYCMSFIFTVDSAAQTFTMFFNFIVMLICSIAVYALQFVRQLQSVGDQLDWVMRILPPYSVVDAVLFDSSGKTLAETRNRQAEFKGSVDPDPYHWKNNTFDYILAGIHFVIWCFVLYAIEQGWSCKCLSRLRQVQLPKQKDLVLDEDVKAEAMRVEKSEERMKIRVEKLRKVYMTGIGPCSRGQPFLAVENLSFGLSAGECFALLGVNGAGKSTTFKILTTEVTPTNGSIEINGVSIAEDSSQLSKQIGYCPQTNPIFEEMSVDEHLYYFARIKGIPDKLISELVEEAVNELNLQDHRHKPAGALSGGNKRKLAVAMAIVGRPSIILLDEPSAGMDPEARRFMWKVVAKIASNKTSAVILTTHSMDEAEALSTKMGIMVKGGIFKCFGSAQRIRNKFGQGYIVEIKIAQPTKEQIAETLARFDTSASITVDMESLKRVLDSMQLPQFVRNQLELGDKQTGISFQEIANQIFAQTNLSEMLTKLCQTFGEVELLEKYGSYIKVRVATRGRSLGQLFGIIESVKSRLSVSDYSVSQTTLEQIFQSFANLKFDESIQRYGLTQEGLQLLDRNETAAFDSDAKPKLALETNKLVHNSK